MLFCVRTPISKLYVFGIALLLAATLAGCGSSGGGTTTTTERPDPPTMPEPTPQEQCEAAGGRWNEDMTCTSADDLEAERVARAAAATKVAGTKETAIAAEAAQATDAGLGGTGVTTVSMAISRDADGTKVEITDTALAGADDPKFMQAEDLGGGSTMHARAMAADADGNVVEEVVIVSTDIEAPTATPFAEIPGQALNRRNDYQGINANNPADSLGLTAGTGSLHLIKSDGLSPGGQGEIRYFGDNSSTTDEDEAFVAPGTYNGAMGTYKCHNPSSDRSSYCTITYGADGRITTLGANWIFTPAPGATIPVPDSDFLRYGVWLKKTTDKDGAVTYNEVETFAASSVAASTGTELNDVEGSAAYEGGATGVYVKNVYDSQGKIETATSGHFMAAVNIMASFGGDDIPVNKQNRIEGTIDNFVLSGGEENSWAVNLEGTRATDANTITGAANGGGAAATWSGTFHGPTPLTADTTDSATNRDMPGVVVGEFNANFNGGAAAGAFGARKK